LAQDDRRLKVLMHASFTGGRGYYGSPRIQDDFLEWGERVSRKRIIRLMQEDGLKARVRKRYKGTTMSDHDQPIADNLLQQEFTAERPNQRWVGDTSELRIGENGKARRTYKSKASPSPQARLNRRLSLRSTRRASRSRSERIARVPMHVRTKLRLGFRITGHDVVLFEERPAFRLGLISRAP
jgi:transposase InsO family protein